MKRALGIQIINRIHKFLKRLKIKQKILTTKHNPRKTIVASNKRYEYMQINDFMISIKGDIRKNVISTYMKCYNLLLLWRKFS